MSSTRARFASDSTSCSSARRRRRSWRRTPATSSNSGRRSSGRRARRLVDHALADEQEGVLGEVRGVEQVDEVLQSDALAIEQVVVLAGAIQPPAELDDAVLDRQEPVAVVERELHVGHPDGRPLLRAGPDDVLGLARPKRPALLAERPAQGVREVALAGAVRADDRADPGSEPDLGAVGKRLEALQPDGQEPGGRRHPRCASASSAARASSTATASAAAAVSAIRRDDPMPIPSTSPPTATSTRNTFAWSGPTASITR